MGALPVRLVCSGCGWEVPADEPRPFRCPRALADGDEIDHVLARRFDVAGFPAAEVEEMFGGDEAQPFARFRRLLYSYRAPRAAGMSEDEWVALVRGLDRAVAGVEGHGFRVTPFGRQERLARAVGVDTIWVKDETGNVGGSHKGRHLMGLAIWLEATRAWSSGGGGASAAAAPLVIASCGNAALAAAVVARAARRPIEVFIPPHADRPVIDELRRHQARLTTCPRRPGEAGDPCYLRFREAVAAGAVPFSCQGNENGLSIEGGLTLAWEIAAALRDERRRVDHLLVQVGGGALATACIEGLREARSLGVLGQLPRLHAVQTEAVHPLYRAHRRIAARLLGEPPPPADRESESCAEDDERARRILAEVPAERLAAELKEAARHRSAFMWPWEREARSLANAILDDEAYDWVAVLDGMLQSGGFPLLVSEELLAEANELALESTGLPVGATGSAGLAGLLRLRREGVIAPGETALLLFTGVTRFR